MQVVVDSLLINYTDEGKGKVMLLLHGWGDSLTTFNELISKLSKNYRVIALDLPGFGGSQPPDEAWDLDNYAKLLKSFLNKLNINKLSVVLGHSNGGALAIRSLSTGDLSAKKLILLASSGVRPKKTIRRLGLKTVAKTGKVATYWLPETKKRKLREKLYGVAGSDMLAVPHMQETFKKTVKQDVLNDVKKIKIPALLIYGDNDRATPVEDGKLFAEQFNNSVFVELVNAGHFVHHDEPEKVYDSIRKFLNV